MAGRRRPGRGGIGFRVLPGERPPAASDRHERAEAGAAFDALLDRRGDEVLVTVDDRLRIQSAGPEAVRLAERPASALPGMSLIAAFGSAPLDAVAREALTTHRPAAGEARLGRLGERTFRIEALPTAVGGLVLALHDVTVLHRMERARRDFVANISHELRTPLASIKLLAETLSSGATDAAAAADFASQIERQVDHLTQLVDELLDLSGIEAGGTRLAIEEVAPGEIVADVIERMRPLAERRRITLRDISAPIVGSTMADAARVSQALGNLVHNAIKFSHAGGEVRVGWEPRHDRIRFVVSDDGIGIAESHQARIFERFYKVDRARARDGDDESGSAGLGLAIVRHIAEAHGGSAGVESRERRGSTFWIEVPRTARH